MKENLSITGLDTEMRKILILGIGNSCRSDDGLGWKFVEIIEELGYNAQDYEFRYQLQVEDAALIAHYDVVIFVDASMARLKEGFEIKPCTAIEPDFFSTHAQKPEAILYLTNKLYGKFPHAYTLAISGLEWALSTSLSQEAETNLQTALGFFIEKFLPAIQPELVDRF